MQVPVTTSPWANIWKPSAAPFPGPDSEHFKAGEMVHDWIANDHTFIQDRQGHFHVFGIINPDGVVPHEGAWQVFHIESRSARLAECLAPEAWIEHPMALTVAERPDENRRLFAPFVVQRDDIYYMFYGPDQMRLAVSDDLFSWTPEGSVFEQAMGARDPWIFEMDGLYHMAYCAGNSVFLRTSSDLRHWAADPCEILRMTRPGAPESPVLLPFDGRYYLFWCIYDGTNSKYDDRTFVQCADTPYDFNDTPIVATLRVHAPEIVCCDNGWYISSAERPHRGISLAPLVWAAR